MKKPLFLTLALVAVFAVIFFLRPKGSGGGDDYDYAAAFESQDASSGLPLFRLADIAGKSVEAVSGPLGEPSRCAISAHSTRCHFALGETEVVFIDGKADWITIGEPGELKFEPAAVRRIGLIPRAPDEQRADELVWTGLAGLREVRVVGVGEQVEFIRVKVKS